MRYLIVIPCMDMVHTLFMASLLSMERPEGTQVHVCSSSLIYDARNELAMRAVQKKYGRVLWLDSDMVFGPDLMTRLIQDMDEGRQFVSALYYTRKKPIMPCVYKALEEQDGQTKAVCYEDYPRDTVFEIAGCGFGAVMMDTDVLTRAGAFGRPFQPMDGWGEDLSFALRARMAGVTLYCDSRLQLGHAGISVIDRETWEGR